MRTDRVLATPFQGPLPYSGAHSPFGQGPSRVARDLVDTDIAELRATLYGLHAILLLHGAGG